MVTVFNLLACKWFRFLTLKWTSMWNWLYCREGSCAERHKTAKYEWCILDSMMLVRCATFVYLWFFEWNVLFIIIFFIFVSNPSWAIITLAASALRCEGNWCEGIHPMLEKCPPFRGGTMITPSICSGPKKECVCYTYTDIVPLTFGQSMVERFERCVENSASYLMSFVSVFVRFILL